jgi:hypothetical protein
MNQARGKINLIWHQKEERKEKEDKKTANF